MKNVRLIAHYANTGQLERVTKTPHRVHPKVIMEKNAFNSTRDFKTHIGQVHTSKTPRKPSNIGKNHTVFTTKNVLFLPYLEAQRLEHLQHHLGHDEPDHNPLELDCVAALHLLLQDIQQLSQHVQALVENLGAGAHLQVAHDHLVVLLVVLFFPEKVRRVWVKIKWV